MKRWEDEEDADWESEDAIDEPTIECPHCRRLIHEESQRCPFCEQYLSTEDSRSVSKPLWIIVGVIICLIIICVWIFS